MNLLKASLLVMLAAILAGAASDSNRPESAQETFARAEKLRAEGSFALARELYDKLAAAQPAPPEAVLNAARVWGADCSWRERGDHQKIEDARKRLERLVEDLPADQALRAEAVESLGDLLLQYRRYGDAEPIYKALTAAREFWGSSTAAGATARYIRLNFKLAEFFMQRIGRDGFAMQQRVSVRPRPQPNLNGFEIVRDAARNVLRVSQEPADRTRALLLLGQAHTRSADAMYDPPDKEWQRKQAERRKEAEDYFRQACDVKTNNRYNSQAHWDFSQYLSGRERYVEAVAICRQLLGRYKPGEAEEYDRAKKFVEQTTAPSMSVNAARGFAPGSYIHAQINYRNVSAARLALRRIEFATYIDGHFYWNQNQEASGRTILEKPVEGLVDEGKHIRRNKELHLDPLEPGIYQIILSSPKLNRPVWTQAFFVGALGVAGKLDRDKAEMFVANADSGAAVKGASAHVLIWEQAYDKEPERFLEAKAKTDAGGRATVALPELKPNRARQFFFVARNGNEVAASDQWGNPYPYWRQRRGSVRPGEAAPIMMHAYTDRPAYRPGEEIHWKAIVRSDDGEAFSLPDIRAYKIRIRDARGGVALEITAKPSEFGTIEGKLTPNRSVALGMLSIELINPDPKGDVPLANAQLCRLEEYKLPEYKVAVEPGKGPFRLGTAIPFTVQAEYYFGGPVAGATAQIVVRRAPFWPGWGPIRPFDWLYDDSDEDYAFARRFRGRPYAPEQIVLQKTVTLDAAGKANIEVPALSAEETKAARDQHYWGYSYRVEARVTDLSRREISASGSVKAALSAFAAYLNPQRYLYLPGDPVKIDLATLDPNDTPVAAEGLITVYKREWDKNRVDANGRKVPGYKDTELFSRPAVTGTDGKATIDINPEASGYYFIKYRSHDAFGEPVEGETTVCIAGKNTTAIGYRSGGAEIIVDRTTYEQGDTIQALIVTRRPGVSVWLAVEGEAILAQQVVAMKGTAQLVPIKVDKSFTPNVYLTTTAMYDFSGFSDQKMVRVPPVNELLNVKVISDKADYRPGETANVRVEVRDHAGKPVRAELSLGVADASVWAIQGDVAGDVRKAFWGRTRSLAIQTMASPQSYTIEFWQPKKDQPGQFERKMREEIPPQLQSAGGRYERGNHEFAFFNGEGGAFAVEDRSSPSATKAINEPLAMSRRMGALETPEPRVRTNFASTAYWAASVVTGADGNASATFTMPDSLTTWRATSLALTQSTQVGQETREVKTNKPIMVRPQVPRYFIQGDKATVSAIVTNNTSESQQITVKLGVSGLQFLGIYDQLTSMDYKPEKPSPDPIRSYHNDITIGVPANSQRRVDWIDVTALTTGTATIRMSALAPIDSDAAEKTYPVLEYGIEKFIAKAAVIRDAAGEAERTLTLSIPADRRPGSEGLTVWIEPTLARAMVNALPYLAQYPYGCVEQTMSRFVPAVITQKTLQQLGIKNDKLEKELPDMIRAGLDRLYDFQHADGGWGWWKEGESDPWMSAYVIQGFAQAREADVNVRPDVIERGAQFLRVTLVKAQDEEDLEAWMLYALASVKGQVGEDGFTRAAHERLWPQREKLNPYTRALYALACQMSGRTERAQTLARNMMNGLVEDKANGTAHWGKERIWWRWSDGGIEATAFGLRALLAIDPQSPVVDEAMTWLVRNRRGCRWQSTRDTAIVIRALADYIKTRGEDKPDWTAEIVVNGHSVKTLKVTPETVFSLEGEVNVPMELLKTGDNEVKIVRRGSGTLYASAWLTYFTREEKIEPAGNEVFAERRFFRTEMQPTPSGVYKQVRAELKDGDVLKSGDRVEVELNLEAKNNYEYVVIEDLKAAGLEPVELQSGGAGGSSLWGHKEIRDEKTAFFIDRMPEGKHTLKYELRAEVPGVFHALPCLVHAMYVPEIRANSSNATIRIE